MKKDEKKLKIEKAPQEAIRFNAFLIDLFIVEVLGIEGFMISDESRVDDFLSYLDTDGVQVSADEYEFQRTYFDTKKAKEETGKHFFELSKKERNKYKLVKTEKLHRNDIHIESELLRKTEKLFGVAIEKEHLHSYLVDLGKHLSSKITPEKRKELEEKYT